MKRLVVIATILLACIFATESRAQAPTSGDRPVKATGVCKDGSFATETDREEACKAHRGVQEWWGRGGPPATTDSAGTPAAPAASSGGLPGRAEPSVRGPSAPPRVNPPQNEVWADPSTKMYHPCTTGEEHAAPTSGEQPTAREQIPGGQLMTEEQAKSKGFRAGAHRMNCR